MGRLTRLSSQGSPKKSSRAACRITIATDTEATAQTLHPAGTRTTFKSEKEGASAAMSRFTLKDLSGKVSDLYTDEQKRYLKGFGKCPLCETRGAAQLVDTQGNVLGKLDWKLSIKPDPTRRFSHGASTARTPGRSSRTRWRCYPPRSRRSRSSRRSRRRSASASTRCASTTGAERHRSVGRSRRVRSGVARTRSRAKSPRRRTRA